MRELYKEFVNIC